MKQKITYILFLFSALFTYGQVTLIADTEKEQKVNQRFNLTVILEINGENMEQETPLRMPDLSKFDIIGSASEQNTVVLDSKKGNVLNQMIYQWVLSPKQAGKVKFGSVLVTVNGKIYKTEPFDISVKETEKKSSLADNSKNDIYLNLEVQNRDVYRNEPTIATLRAYSKDLDNFRKVKNIHYSQQKNANIKPINFNKSEIESSAGISSQIIGLFMIFPSETGNIEINPVSALVKNSSKESKILSNKVKLNVKKLPEGMPENYKNAVGKFNIDIINSYSEKTPEVEKPVNITMNISGTGNLTNLHIPKMMASKDYVFYPPKITSKTAPKDDNISGNISADYVVIPKKTGVVFINFEDFSFFDPEKKEYVDLGAKSISLNVKTAEQIADAKTTIEKVNEYTNTVLETVNTPVLKTHNLKIKEDKKIHWGTVFGNLALMAAFLSVFLFVRKKIKQKKQKPKDLQKNITSISETEEILRKNMSVQIDDYIEYLKKMKENKDFTKFFSTYQELNEEVKNMYSQNTEAEFRKFLEEHKGQKIAEEYRSLSEKIQIEKYAPFHSDENIDELLKSITSLYLDISK